MLVNYYIRVFFILHFSIKRVSTQGGSDSTFSECGGQITVDNGNITSPGYPANYENNLDCTWTIPNDNGFEIRLTFLSIDIENSRSCQYDFLSLTFADSSREKYCGRQLPDPQEGALPATFSFSTDVSVGGRGFSISFQVITPCLSEPCQNGGTCQSNRDSFQCLCSSEWEGSICEIAQTSTQSALSTIDSKTDNFCEKVECLNGGSCIIVNDVGNTACVCLEGFEGLKCQKSNEYSMYFIGMMITSGFSLFCVFVLALVVYRVLRKQASKQSVEPLFRRRKASKTDSGARNQNSVNVLRHDMAAERSGYALPHQIRDGETLFPTFPTSPETLRAASKPL